MKFKIQLLVLISALTLLLAACSSGTEESSTSDDSPTASVVTLEAAAVPTAEPTSTPEPAVEPTTTPETVQESSNEPPDDFIGFESESFDIQLSHPDGWLVTEDPELGLIIESSEGFFGSMPEAEGGAVIILPRDDLAGEDVVEALRLSVFDLGPPPDIFIEYPTVSKVGEHDVATAAFNVRESGMDGFYVFVQREDQGVFIFAASTGLGKAYHLELMESVIGTVELGGETATS